MTERDYRRLFLEAPFGYVVTDTDERMALVNDTLLSWLGRERGDVEGQLFGALLDPGSRIFWQTRHQPVLLLSGEVREVALTLNTADGPLSVLTNSSLIVDDAGNHVGSRIALLDTSQRYEYERSLLADVRAAERSNERTQVLQSLASDLSSATTEQQVVDRLVASALAAFQATAVSVFLPDASGALVSVGGTPRVPLRGGAVLQSYEENRTITVDGFDQAETSFPEFLDVMRDQRVEAFSVVPLGVDGPPLGVLLCTFSRERPIEPRVVELQQAIALQASDALVRLRRRAALQQQTMLDPLTGLANRRALHEHLQEAIAAQRPLAVAFLDLDGFKRVNDEQGHAVGDLVLTEIAGRIRDALRADDFCARFGGDEFVILTRDADLDAAGIVAERVRSALEAPLAATASVITTSIGLAVIDPGPDVVADRVLTAADAAMYRSKQAGGNRVTVETVR